jgi:hypothetical protein
MMKQNVHILWPCTHQCTFHLTCYDLILIVDEPQPIDQGSTFVTHLLLNPLYFLFPLHDHCKSSMKSTPHDNAFEINPAW